MRDILTEHERARTSIQRDGDSCVVPGNTPLHELSRVVGIDLDLETDYTTIAGLCMELAARTPKTGAILIGPRGARIEILNAMPNQVRLARVTAPLPAGARAVAAH